MQFHVGMHSSFFPREAASRRAASRRAATHCSLLHETVLSGKAMSTYANDALYVHVATRSTNAVKVTQPHAKPITRFFIAILYYLSIPYASCVKVIRKVIKKIPLSNIF